MPPNMCPPLTFMTYCTRRLADMVLRETVVPVMLFGDLIYRLIAIDLHRKLLDVFGRIQGMSSMFYCCQMPEIPESVLMCIVFLKSKIRLIILMYGINKFCDCRHFTCQLKKNKMYPLIRQDSTINRHTSATKSVMKSINNSQFKN